MPDLPQSGAGAGAGAGSQLAPELRAELADILDSINNAVAVDRSRVTTIQLVRAQLKLQSMLA